MSQVTYKALVAVTLTGDLMLLKDLSTTYPDYPKIIEDPALNTMFVVDTSSYQIQDLIEALDYEYDLGIEPALHGLEETVYKCDLTLIYIKSGGDPAEGEDYDIKIELSNFELVI